MKVHEITDEVGDAHVRAWVDGRKVVIELGELPDEHGITQFRARSLTT